MIFHQITKPKIDESPNSNVDFHTNKKNTNQTPNPLQRTVADKLNRSCNIIAKTSLMFLSNYSVSLASFYRHFSFDCWKLPERTLINASTACAKCWYTGCCALIFTMCGCRDNKCLFLTHSLEIHLINILSTYQHNSHNALAMRLTEISNAFLSYKPFHMEQWPFIFNFIDANLMENHMKWLKWFLLYGTHFAWAARLIYGNNTSIQLFFFLSREYKFKRRPMRATRFNHFLI